MSTLTSSQLHVKRSSTRLHAPPGGASSISFGPGGLGTVDAAVDESEKATSADPAAALPPSRSSGYDYAPSTTYAKPRGGGTPDYTVPGSSYSINSYGYNNNNNNYDTSSAGGGDGGTSSWGNQNQYPYAHTPPPMSVGRSGSGMPSTSYSGRPVSSASNASSSRSWGSQPPLTSSKRDQNWERKRRQWLARKHGARPQSNASLPMPPGSAYNSSSAGMMPPMQFGGGGGGYSSSPYDDYANAPPSPLSKFVHQQSQKQQQSGSYGAFTDYERIGTAQSQGPPPMTAGPPFTYNSGSNNVPPSRSGFASNSSSAATMGYGAPPPTTGSMSHLRMAAPPDAATASLSRGGTAAGVSTSGSGGYAASARQPPGGRSNWSPFS